MKSFNITSYNSIPCVDSFSLFLALGYAPAYYPTWATYLSKQGDEGIDFFKQKSMLFDASETRVKRRYHITLLFACELCAASRSQNGRLLKYEFRRILGINVKK